MNFFAFLRRHKTPFIEIFFASFLINLFALSLPIFSSFVYDKILGNGITETLWALAVGLTFLMVIDFSVKILRVMAAERFSKRSNEEIDQHVFKGLIKTDTKKIPSIGRFLDRYKQTLSYRDFLSSSYLMALVDIPFLVLFLLAIFYAAGPLVFVPLVCGGLLLLLNAMTLRPTLEYDMAARRAGEGRFHLLTDVLAAHEILSLGRLKKDLLERWSLVSLVATEDESKARFWRAMGTSFSSSLTYISYVSLIVGGVYMVEDRALTAGGLLAATMLSARTMGCFSSLTNVILRYREFKSAMREMGQLLPPEEDDTKLYQSMSEESLGHGKIEGRLFLDSVTCRLGDDNKTVFSNLSLKINKGEIVGLVGSPGAGKTTLMRLIAGALEPDEGRVLIDHFPVRALPDEELAEHLSYKPQEPSLMEGSIESNIRAGRETLDEATRQNILTRSGLDWAFEQSGLDWATEVGPRGTYLSGGQRQLVSLGRAFYGEPAILLLDEPSNGLDTVLENRLAETIKSFKGKKTVLVSAHSRALLMACDRLIVLGQGKILADGAREKILK